MAKVILKVAGIIISIQSRFPLIKVKEEDARSRRFEGFYCKSMSLKPNIQIRVEVVRDLSPFTAGAKKVFFVHHPDDGSDNWQLFVKRGEYIFESLIEDRRQVMVINGSFDNVKAYVLPYKKKKIGRKGIYSREKLVWDVFYIIYDFLQILLIHYLAQRNEGIFVHAAGIRQAGGRGLLFAGKSGAGKTTLAKLWHAYDSRGVLNDDRVIIRFIKGKFVIFTSPWHGDFSDYLSTVTCFGKAVLGRIFFISHSKRNIVRQMIFKKSFPLFYTTIFPVFWNKTYLENIVSFCYRILSDVPCSRIGFVKNKTVIQYIKKLH